MSTERKKIRPAWFLPAVYGGLWFAGFGVLLGSVWLIGHELADRPGSRLNRASAAVTAQITGPVAARNNNQLGDAIRLLQRDRRLGLVYLRVFRADGSLVARTGRYESSGKVVRNLLYGFLSKDIQVDLVDSESKVGRVEFGLGWFAGDGAGSVAQWAGVVGVFVSIPLLVWLSFRLAWITLTGSAPSGWANALRRKKSVPPGTAAVAAPATPMGRSQPETAALSQPQQILNAIGAGIVCVNRDGRIDSANAAAGKLLEVRPSDLLREPLTDIFQLSDALNQPWKIPLTDLLAGKSIDDVKINVRGNEGASRALYVSGWPVRDRMNAVHSAVVMFRAVGSESSLQRAMQQKLALGGATFAVMSEAVVAVDKEGKITFANRQASQLYGKPGQGMQGLNVEDLLPQEANHNRHWQKLLSESRGVLRDSRGGLMDVGLAAAQLPGYAGQVVLMSDLGDQKTSANTHARLEQLMAHSGEEIFAFHGESLRFVAASNVAEKKLGFGWERLRNMTLLDLTEKLSAEKLAEYMRELKSGKVNEVYFQTRLRRENGAEYLVDARLYYSGQEEPPVFLLMAHEPGAHGKNTADGSDDRLLFLAYYDSLTALPSRLMFMDRLHQAMMTANRTGNSLCVAVLSLNGLKTLNSRLGYEAGDKFLQAIANGLQSVIGAGGQLSRLSTDFILALPCDSNEKAEKLLGPVRDRAADILRRSNVGLHIRLTMGYTLYPEDKVEADSLLTHALAAADQSNAESRLIQLQKYSSEMDKSGHEAESPDAGDDQANILREALSREYLGLNFSSVVRNTSGRVGAVLVRLDWSQVRGLEQDAGIFAATAQRTGLAQDLSVWMTRRVCEAMQEWRDLGMTSVPTMVDFSLFEPFRMDTIEAMLDIIEQYEIQPENITFGVSQQALQVRSRWLESLQQAGIGILVCRFDASATGEEAPPGLSVNYAEIMLDVTGTDSDTDQAVKKVKASIARANKLKTQIMAAGDCSDQGRQILAALGCKLAVNQVEGGNGARQFGVELSRAELEPLGV